MKFNKKVFLNTLILLFIFSYLLAVPGAVKSQEVGAILVAHGSKNQAWNDDNKEIKDLYDDIKNEISPLKLVYLRFDNAKKLEVVTANMKNSGVRKIQFVHLSPSSYSVRHQEIDEVVSPILPDDQYEYGIVAMDDHPKIVEILKIYADELSEDPKKESLILVGYGATYELNNKAWIKQLENIGKVIHGELKFKEIVCMTLRYHSADSLRSQAVENLRIETRRLMDKGKVLVVPYVMCQGSFQEDLKFYLKEYLEGNDPPVGICMKGVIDHDNTKAWVREVINNVRSGGALPKIKTVNSSWSAMDAEIGGNKKHEYGHAEKKVITTTPK